MITPGAEADPAAGSHTPYDLDRCRFEAHCTTGTRQGPGPAAGRGLCPPDELQGLFAIEQLPRLYADLADRTAKDAGRTPGGRLGGGHAVEAPTPLVLHMDVAAREIVWTLRVWAARVAEVLRGPDRSVADVNLWAPARAAKLLSSAFPVLRNLRPDLYTPYVRDGEGRPVPAEDDGPGAVVQLTTLYRRSRSILGETQQHEARHLPCPRPVPPPRETPDAPPGGGCGQDGTLVRQIGREGVRCTHCGWNCSDAEYDLYALTFVPPRSRRRIERDVNWGDTP